MTRKMIPQDSGATLARALVIEMIFFLFAAAVSIGLTAPYEEHKLKISLVIALTAVAMGLRNSVALIWSGVRRGFCCKSSAAAPLTIGG